MFQWVIISDRIQNFKNSYSFVSNSLTADFLISENHAELHIYEYMSLRKPRVSNSFSAAGRIYIRGFYIGQSQLKNNLSR